MHVFCMKSLLWTDLKESHLRFRHSEKGGSFPWNDRLIGCEWDASLERGDDEGRMEKEIRKERSKSLEREEENSSRNNSNNGNTTKSESCMWAPIIMNTLKEEETNKKNEIISFIFLTSSNRSCCSRLCARATRRSPSGSVSSLNGNSRRSVRHSMLTNGFTSFFFRAV